MIVLIIVDGLLLPPDLRYLPFFHEMTGTNVLGSASTAKGAWTRNMKLTFPKTELAISVILHGVDNCFLNIDAMDVAKGDFSFEHHPSCIESIFKIIKPKKSCFIAATKSFQSIFNPKYLDLDWTTSDNDINRKKTNPIMDKRVIQKTIKAIHQKDIALVVSYLENPDFIAHKYGMGKEYSASVTKVDKQLARICKSMTPEDTLFVVCDHGRTLASQLKEHDQLTRETNEVPFFAFGNGVRQGEITTPLLHLMDIAPTIAAFFGISVARKQGIRGKVIRDVLI
jgi:predicted AlkP superfamily pyrophosphatase or phosphodiesterase